MIEDFLSFLGGLEIDFEVGYYLLLAEEFF